VASAFHLTALPFGNEEQTLAAAKQALEEVDPGETIFFSEAVAWTASASGVAYASLVRAARKHDVNIIATLNLGPELIEDLPGRQPEHRYHALVVFTRHSHVHVPQAKILPDAFEQRPGLEQEALPVTGYTRSNLVRFDIDEQIVEMRFFIGADLAVITDHPPRAFACDVLVAPARLPNGAEDKLRLSLVDAREAGVASTALIINGHAADNKNRPVCVRLEDAADNGKAVTPKARWGAPTKLQRRLYRYTQKRRGPRTELEELERLASDEKRKDRIPVFRAPRAPKVELGLYPILIAM
jgi:hypothetical protein